MEYKKGKILQWSDTVNVLKPALSISILIHFLYIIGILFFAYFNNTFLTNNASFIGEIPILLMFSTFVFTAIISLILWVIRSTNLNS